MVRRSRISRMGKSNSAIERFCLTGKATLLSIGPHHTNLLKSLRGKYEKNTGHMEMSGQSIDFQHLLIRR